MNVLLQLYTLSCLTGTTASGQAESLLQFADPSSLEVPPTYYGPHVQLPLTLATVQNIIEHFKSKRVSTL